MRSLLCCLAAVVMMACVSHATDELRLEPDVGVEIPETPVPAEEGEAEASVKPATCDEILAWFEKNLNDDEYIRWVDYPDGRKLETRQILSPADMFREPSPVIETRGVFAGKSIPRAKSSSKEDVMEALRDSLNPGEEIVSATMPDGTIVRQFPVDRYRVIPVYGSHGKTYALRRTNELERLKERVRQLESQSIRSVRPFRF